MKLRIEDTRGINEIKKDTPLHNLKVFLDDVEIKWLKGFELEMYPNKHRYPKLTLELCPTEIEFKGLIKGEDVNLEFGSLKEGGK